VLDIHLLGPLELRVGGRDRALSGSRERRLFALLALNINSLVTFDRIVDALWEEPPRSVRQQVHNTIASLRRTLRAPGSDVELANRHSGYILRGPEDCVDAVRFSVLVHRAEKRVAAGDRAEGAALFEAALAEWRGTAMDGLSGGPLDNARSLLDEQRISALEQLAEIRLDAGEGHSSVTELTELVAQHPLRESARALLMRTLQQSGRQADALSVFEQGRRILAEELGLDPGQVLADAHSLVLTSAADSPPPRVPDAVGAPGTSFIPRAIAEFTGRAEETAAIGARVREAGAEAPVVAVLDGMGGVGKTTLAVHLAHRHAQDFPEAQYFVDLAGYTTGVDPLTASQALNTLLRQANVSPELIPPDLDGRAALWRAQLSGHRTLLVLDNAGDVAQVRPLLPASPGTLTLISTRRRMTSLEGAVSMPLDVLGAQESVELFSRIIGHERAHADPAAVLEAVELCGRLPLAVQIAAARLRSRTSWPIGYLVEQLKDQRTRMRVLAVDDRNVHAVLSLSYRHLTEPQRRLFRLLSVHPGRDIDAYAAASLADMPLEEAELCLDELYESNLVQQPAPGRFTMHDLVRDCSHELLREEGGAGEGEAAFGRLVDFLARCVQSWCSPLMKPVFRVDVRVENEPRALRESADRGECIRIVDTEYLNILAIVEAARGAGMQARIWQIAHYLTPYLSKTDFGPDAESLFTSAVDCARSTGERRGAALCLTSLSMALNARGAQDEAIRAAQEALAISRELEDLVSELGALTQLGMLRIRAGRFDEAADCFAQALDVSERLDDPSCQASSINNLGLAHRRRGRLGEALRCFRRVIEIYEQVGAAPPPTETFLNIGRVLALQGDYQGAEQHYRRALELSERAQAAAAKSLSLIGLSNVGRLTGAYPSAIEFGRAALDLARSRNLGYAEANALNALGDAHMALGDTSTARSVYQTALTSAQQRQLPELVAWSQEGLAHAALAEGDRSLAEDLWRTALDAPLGVVDTAGALAHLADLDRGRGACVRCRAASS